MSDPSSRRPPSVSAQTLAAIERGTARLSRLAMARVDREHDWYRELPAQTRSWVGLVAQAGIGSLAHWLGSGADQTVTASVFGTAPRELTATISLAHTLDLLRGVVDAVEDEVASLAVGGDEPALREAVLRYSREIAFAAAHLYARAAEARGAWDARLEALVVDAVVRGDDEDVVHSRATALGWEDVDHVCVVAGPAPEPNAVATEGIRRTAGRHGAESLLAVQRHRMIVVLGGVADPAPVVGDLIEYFGDGPVVVGPTVADLVAASASAQAAIVGLAAAPAWPQAPRPVPADELIPERALLGDPSARDALVARIDTPLASSAALARTAEVYLESAGLEAAARLLFVHPNTVRYRLGRIADLTGYDLSSPRDGYAVRLALAFGRLRRSGVLDSGGRPDRAGPEGGARGVADSSL